LRLFFFSRKAGCALANTTLAIVIILQSLRGRPIVFARSTDYYPPGKQKQKNSLAEFLRRLPSGRFLHVVQKVRSMQTDFKNLVLWGVMLYSLVDGCRRFGVFCCLRLHGRRVRPAPVALKMENRKKGKTR